MLEKGKKFLFGYTVLFMFYRLHLVRSINQPIQVGILFYPVGCLTFKKIVCVCFKVLKILEENSTQHFESITINGLILTKYRGMF